MLLKLKEFLKKENCIIFIKYDAERIRNNYTIKIIYNDFNISNIGKDTNNPFYLLKNLLHKTTIFNDSEIIKLYLNIFYNIIEVIKIKLNYECIIILIIKEEKDDLLWELKVYSDYKLNKEIFLLKDKFYNLNKYIKNLKFIYKI